MKEDLVFNHYSKILDNLLTDPVFSYIFQKPREFLENFDSFYYDKMPDNLFLNFGASRLCLIDDDYPYVVKIEYSEHEDCFQDFPNFCEKEAYIYSMAQERNFDRYLTEVKFLGVYRKVIETYSLSDINDYYKQYDSVINFSYSSFMEALEDMEKDEIKKQKIEIALPLYGYEKADLANLNKVLNKEEVKYYRSFNSPLSETNIGVIARFIQDYGLEEYYDFNEFLKEFDIHDIHGDNVGEIYGKIVILDYASYPQKEDENDTELD